MIQKSEVDISVVLVDSVDVLTKLAYVSTVSINVLVQSANVFA